MKAVEAALMAKARALGPRQKQLRLPPPPAVKIPVELERQYYKDLRAEVVARLGRITERILVPALPSLLRGAREDLPTVDSADARRLDSYTRELDVLMNGMRIAYATELTPDEIEALARKYAIRGENWNKTDLAKSLQRVLGINPLVAEPYLPAVMRQFIDENTNLIRSIGSEFFGKIQQDTYKYIQEGVYNKEYAKQISAEFSEEFKRQYERGILKRRVTNADARARLIARDQISKYNGQLNQTRQTALGITKYRWVTVGDDRVRESHRSKNGKIYSWNDPPADTGHPGDDYQCFPADTSVDLCFDAMKGFRRWYDGKLAFIVTDSGESVRCTPNHPFLTNRGWIAAKDLKEGDYLFKISQKTLVPLEVNIYKCKTTIDHKFRLLEKFGIGQTASGTLRDFHGDGTENEIDVVSAQRNLVGGMNSLQSQGRHQFGFSEPDSPGAARSNLFNGLIALLFPFARLVCLISQAHSFFLGKPSHPDKTRLAYVPNSDSITPQNSSNRSPRNPYLDTDRQFADASLIHRNDLGLVEFEGGAIPSEFIDPRIDPEFSQFLAQIAVTDSQLLGDFLQSKPFGYELCRISEVSFREFSGHVYNLETKKGWFIAQDFITKNCRCTSVAVFDEGVTENPTLLGLLNS